MPIKGLGWTFDTVAESYDKYRPTYVAELYQDIFAYQQINADSRVLEIGIGTGQATRPILETGCCLTAIEPGLHLAELTRRKFTASSNLTVEISSFQSYPCPNDAFDLIYSASAFHWIEEQVGYPKVFAALRPGGAFARFASHPYYHIEGQEELWSQIQWCYCRHTPNCAGAVEPRLFKRYAEEEAEYRSGIAAKYGFTDIQTHVYYRDLMYTSCEYVKRLGIESDKIAMAAAERDALLKEIKAAVDRHGGRIVVRDMIDLNLARKPY